MAKTIYRTISSIAILLLIIILFSSNDDNGCGGRGTIIEPVIQKCPSVPEYQTVNIYIESSGSMVGYFNGNSQIKEILKQYHDRITEDTSISDTVTLNFINQSIDEYHNDISSYLTVAASKCTASYTKIDDILNIAMKGVNDSTTNILVSDYCFTSDKGSFQTAESGITKIFRENIDKNKDLSVAIFKYMSDFRGKFFPGGIKCNQPRPFYIWIFGNKKQIKKLVNLDIKNENCGNFLLQLNTEVPIELNKKAKNANARMFNRDGSVKVEDWDKDRNSIRGEVSYSLEFTADMSNVILSDDELLNVDNYSINKEYDIISVENISESKFYYKIITTKPSPGIVRISYLIPELPEWVIKSNYEGKGIPSDSTTLGVKYLIEGVYDAFCNKKNNKYFSFDIVLK